MALYVLYLIFKCDLYQLCTIDFRQNAYLYINLLVKTFIYFAFCQIILMMYNFSPHFSSHQYMSIIKEYVNAGIWNINSILYLVMAEILLTNCHFRYLLSDNVEILIYQLLGHNKEDYSKAYGDLPWFKSFKSFLSQGSENTSLIPYTDHIDRIRLIS